MNVSPMNGVLQELKNETVRLIGCGASHTIIVTGKNYVNGFSIGLRGVQEATAPDRRLKFPDSAPLL